MKIQVDISKEVSKKLELHKIRYNLYDKRQSLIDVLERFFSDEDYDYFLNKNKEIKTKAKKKVELDPGRKVQEGK